MTALLAYRGPDDEGFYEDGEVRLGHRRLSILDLTEAGHEPMQSDDGQLVVTLNGEIYNFRELRRELEKVGYRFHTANDTEVLLSGYHAFGIEVLSRLEGMFAFALWDRKQRQLLLARDRTGIKPLFYYQQDDGLAFASELKSLLVIPGLVRRVNHRALRSAIRFAGNIEDESMLASVFKLPPANWLIWKNGFCQRGTYWAHPTPSAERWNEKRLITELRTTLANVVKSHMISDVPLGASLSGGLDSSGIVALMSHCNQPGKVETFTVGHGTDDPDLINARIVADHCRTSHHEILVSAQNVTDLLPRIVWHLDEPLGHMETVQMYATYREASRFVKVLLIGDGADECFGGYSRYKILQRGFPLPLALSRDLYRRVYQNSEGEATNSSGRALGRFLWGNAPLSPFADTHPPAESPMTNLQARSSAVGLAMNYDQRTILPHLYLKRADALGMAHSLELRVPFVDRRIVELAARIPGRMMVRRNTEKYILRKTLAPFLPPNIAWRRKHPQQMQVNGGMIEALDHLSSILLRPSDVRERGFFDPARVQALLRNRPNSFNGQVPLKFWCWRIWSLIQCELWARIFLDRPISSSPPVSLAELV
jgi:asparagine synthase (glutamine-hydrolysing)